MPLASQEDASIPLEQIWEAIIRLKEEGRKEGREAAAASFGLNSNPPILLA